MKLHQPIDRPNLDSQKKRKAKYQKFAQLIEAINARDLPDAIAEQINQNIDIINAERDSDKGFFKKLRKTQSSILKLIEKELGLVCKNHYQRLWMVMGMTIFGVPMGVVFGSTMDNMGMIGIGIPIGMGIGIAIGSGKDKEAEKKGLQLDISL